MNWLSPDFVRAVAVGDIGIAITGAGSWLGQAMLGMLVVEGALTNATRLRLFGSVARPLQLANRVIAIEPLQHAAPLDSGAWLLLHLAFLGKERTADLTTDAFIAGNAAILADTLRVASGATDLRMVFTSSGAVYGPDRSLTSDRNGNPYGWCKATQEAQIAAWCESRNVPLVMPRIFNIGGPYANKVESYALSSMILSAQRTATIEVRATRPTYRSYVHVNELLGVVCEAVLAQPVGCPLLLDTAGDVTVEMADLAARVVVALSPASIAVTRGVFDRDAVPDRYIGDGREYRSHVTGLGHAVTSLDAIVADTTRFLTDSSTASPARMHHG